MKLRAQIVELIKKNEGNIEKAGIDICLFLEDQLDLDGNGWFDDDHEFQEVLLERD